MLRSESISCVVILNGYKPVGIFTERDILKATVQNGKPFLDQPISRYMSSPTVTVTRDVYVYEAYNLLASNNLRHLVVVDGNGIAVGVVTESDLVQHLGLEYFIEVKKIAQIMTRVVYTAAESRSFVEVLEKMSQKNISCIIVEKDKLPVGILTERDVARILIERDDINSLTVGQVMTSPVLVTEVDNPVHNASQLMKEKGIRRLVVVDAKGQIEGVITQTDIVLGLEGKYVEILREVIREKDSQLRETVESLFEKTVYLDNILTSSIDMGIVATDIDLRVNYANPSAESILGCCNGGIIDYDLARVLRDRDVDTSHIDEALDKVRTSRKRYTFHFERRVDKDIRCIRADMSGISDRKGHLIGYVLMLRDITEQKRAEETIRFMAYHDMLTGLPNRALFVDRLNLEMARAVRYQKMLGMMVLDLDGFKDVNDTLGHAAGDLLLKSVARTLERLFRKSDTVARMGGDEFIVLLPDIDSHEHVVAAGEKVKEAFKTPFIVDGYTVNISSSIGMAIYPYHGEDAESLIRNADKAMYCAKENSKSSPTSCLHMLEVGG